MLNTITDPNHIDLAFLAAAKKGRFPLIQLEKSGLVHKQGEMVSKAYRSEVNKLSRLRSEVNKA